MVREEYIVYGMGLPPRRTMAHSEKQAVTQSLVSVLGAEWGILRAHELSMNGTDLSEFAIVVPDITEGGVALRGADREHLLPYMLADALAKKDGSRRGLNYLKQASAILRSS